MTKAAQVAVLVLIIASLLRTLTTAPVASSCMQLRMADAAHESAINRKPNVQSDNTISLQQLKTRLDRFIPAAMADGYNYSQFNYRPGTIGQEVPPPNDTEIHSHIIDLWMIMNERSTE